MKHFTKPKGEQPRHIALWLRVYGQEFWRILTCPHCGGWVDYIDHLAPYYIDANVCSKCEKELEED